MTQLAEESTTKQSKLLSLLSNFKSLAGEKPDHFPTFLEIAGKAHKEDVISNILAFFFKSEQPHGLGDLFLRSFLTCMHSDIQCSGKIDVYREVTTANGKRIDLIVEFDDIVLIIENKINHWLHNDLKEYAAHAERHYKNKKYLLAVLSMDEIKHCEHGFVNVTYKSLLKEIGSQLAQSRQVIQNKYSPLLNDFFETLKNLRSNKMINQDMRTFFIENKNDIQHLLEEKQLLDQEVSNRAYRLLDLITIREDMRKLVWSKHVVVTEKFFPNNMWLKADCIVNLEGYHFHVFVARDGRDQSNLELLESISYFKDKSEWNVWTLSLSYDTPIEEVVEKYNEILKEVFK